MKITKYFQSVILILAAPFLAAAQSKPVAIEPGVSYPLAVYRHSVISDIQYTLFFDIPAVKVEDVDATETIAFKLAKAGQPLQLDFKENADHVKSLTINDKPVAINLQQEHLILPAKDLHAGTNSVSIQFIAGNSSLNRNDDFLYALFVPDRARTVFPCFDQPDLKSKFLLSLSVPKDWKVLANGIKKDSAAVSPGKTLYHFANSDKLPTYLFSFTAGKYTDVKKVIGGRDAEFLHRETDKTKIRLSVDSIFKAHEDAITFLQGWTGIQFPFQKVGWVAIPDFQFGGMEHPGEVQYKASGLFLDDGATKDNLIARSNVISHETAHMWFGDMVTMEWFNDVWMKEVFANFMADKVTEKMMGEETFNLKFLQDHYPAAYGVDRTAGANPIRQQLDNLQDAGSLYGNIIYHKAPIMMRQLEMLMGKDNFQKGIRTYLKKYAYGNATWTDLISILSQNTKANLYAWNKVWVNQPGRPVFNYDVTYQNGRVGTFKLTQKPESGASRVWPQNFGITFVYANSSKSYRVAMKGTQLDLPAVKGAEKPLYILFNSDGMGYGLFPIDKNSLNHLYEIASPLQRATAYINAYENMLAGRSITPKELLMIFKSGLQVEKNEMNLRLVTGYIDVIYWQYLRASDRLAEASDVENSFWTAMERDIPANNKKILFRAYQSVFLTDAGKRRIYQIWADKKAPTGVKLNEDDYTSLAMSLALKIDTATSVLKRQEARIDNVDRRARLEFLMPSLSPDAAVRDQFFNSLSERKNRQKEAWVTSALGYLNSPLRQSTSIKYLRKSLDLTEEIQRTGDVFFPQSWLGAVFGSYQSKEAWQIVQQFLKEHPYYNPKLKDKILQATDNLYRAQNLRGD